MLKCYYDNTHGRKVLQHSTFNPISFAGYVGIFESPNNQWFVIESKHSGLVLEIDGNKCGSRVTTTQKKGGDRQLWTWRYNTLVSKSGYALDMINQNRATEIRVISWDHFGGQTQQWRMENDKIISVLNGYAIDIKDGNREANADIILWPIRYGCINSQSWQLILFYD